LCGMAVPIAQGVYEPVEGIAELSSGLVFDLADVPAPAEQRPRPGYSAKRVAAVVFMAVACCVVVLFFLAQKPLGGDKALHGHQLAGRTSAARDFRGTQPMAVRLYGEDDVANGSRARELTKKYIHFRLANDVKSLEALVAPTAVMDIDLSKANFLLRAKVSLSPGTHLTGPLGFAKYYKEYPAEDGDKPPHPEDIRCSGNSCTVTSHVKRFIGTVTIDAVITWNSDGMIESVKMSLH